MKVAETFRVACSPRTRFSPENTACRPNTAINVEKIAKAFRNDSARFAFIDAYTAIQNTMA